MTELFSIWLNGFVWLKIMDIIANGALHQTIESSPIDGIACLKQFLLDSHLLKCDNLMPFKDMHRPDLLMGTYQIEHSIVNNSSWASSHFPAFENIVFKMQYFKITIFSSLLLGLCVLWYITAPKHHSGFQHFKAFRSIWS